MCGPARFVLTNHASVVLRERGIPVEWARLVLLLPRLLLPDAEDPDLLHAFAPIVERVFPLRLAGFPRV